MISSILALLFCWFCVAFGQEKSCADGIQPLLPHEFALSRPPGCESNANFVEVWNNTASCLAPKWSGLEEPVTVTSWNIDGLRRTKVLVGIMMPNGNLPIGCIPPGERAFTFMPHPGARLSGVGYNVAGTQRQEMRFNGELVDLYVQAIPDADGVHITQPRRTHTCEPQPIGRPRAYGERARFDGATCVEHN